MTRRRWIADEISGNRAFLIGPHADHLARVLRARVGQEFDIAAGTSVRRGRIVTIGRDRVEFELEEEVPAVAVASVTLVLSIFKFDRLEWAIEKCTELGVSRIVPLIARRTDAHLASAAVKRVERWRRIAREASQQSRRASVPEVADPVKPKEAVVMAGATRVLLAESSAEVSLQDAVRTHAHESVILGVGPEGGWTEQEADLFRQAGWISASLGSTILRAETAAIAAVAVVMALLKPESNG
jgi:16S rRNA (uracil1498-N3)-methyltransferase